MPLVKLVRLVVIGCAVCVMQTACRSTQVVTVPEVHEHYTHTTDTLRQLDSVIVERQTTVMQLDSAEMARYGIELHDAQQAWLVQTKELELRLRELESIHGDTVLVRDSVPVPYPVTEYKEKELNWWQSFRLHVGDVVLLLALLVAAVYALRFFGVLKI